MQGIGRLFGFAAMAILAGCATRSDLMSVSSNLEEMKSRLITVEKSVGGIKSEAREETAKTVDPLTKEMETLRRNSADLQASLDSLRVDLQSLGGKVDDTSVQLKKPSDDLVLLKEDSDRRMKTLEERLAVLEKGFEELRAGFSEYRNKEAERNPEQLYQKSLELYRSGNLQKAREQFARFISLFPRHELAANAHYWIGETYYGEKNYDQAILEFQEVIKNFPGKEKVPAAMLKQGMAFRELNDKKSCRYVLRKLTEEFPNSEEARAAKDVLKDL